MGTTGGSGFTNVAGKPGAGASCVWVGLDVAKAKFDAAFLLPQQATPEGQRCASTREFEYSPQGVKGCLQWVREGLLQAGHQELPMRVVMEATSNYSEKLAQWLCEQAPDVAPAIVNPAQAAAFAKSLHLRNSTDPVSARMLALYGHQRSPKAHQPLEKERAELRELCRYRAAQVVEKTAATNRLKAGSSSKEVLRMMKAHLKEVQKKVARLERAIKEHVAAHASLRRDYELLCSIPGVGPVVATVVLAEMGDLRRFTCRGALAAHAGLSPKRVESGSSVHRKTRMSKQGNGQVRAVLYMAAVCAAGHNPTLGKLYQRLVANRKSHRAALGAVMRKLLLLMRAVLIGGECYNAAYNPKNPGTAKTVDNSGEKPGKLQDDH